MKRLAPLAALALLCALLLAALPGGPARAEDTPIDYAAAVRLDMDSETVKAQVRVRSYIDGDTTHFYVPDGITEGNVLSARYLAVNTPESTGHIEEYGKKASLYTRERLSAATSILIESDDGQWNRDSNGTRFLVWVWYRTDESEEYRNLNIELLQEGLAKANSSGQNRYGETCMAAIAQAKARGLNIYSGEKDPDFYYGSAIELTLRELRCHPQQYEGKKVAFSGILTLNSNNSVYVEDYDAETGLYFGMPVYYGYNLSAGGMEILHIGNEVRIVGTVQFYEAGGEYQISGLSYRAMKPNDPNNLQKLSEGHSPACPVTDLDTFLHGRVTVPGEETSEEFDYAQLVLAASLTLEGLTVESAATDDSGVTLTCARDGLTVTVRTGDASGADAVGKTIDVRGVVDLYNGEYQIKAFSADGIAIRQ